MAQNYQRMLTRADEHDRNRIQHRVPKNEHRTIVAAIETHSHIVDKKVINGQRVMVGTA
jgi:hypothetical protein